MKFSLLYTAFFLTLFCAPIHAAQQQTADGGSTRIFQNGAFGEKGFIWVVTHKGIDRYDGFDYVKYKLDESSFSNFEHPQCIELLSNKQPIVATEHSIYRYVREIDQWKQAFLLEARGEYIISLNAVDDALWMGTSKSLFVCKDIHRDTLSFENIPLPKKHPILKVIRIDKQLFVASGRGLWTVTQKGESYDVQPFPLIGGINKWPIHALYYDKDTQNVWIGSSKRGLWVYNLNTKELKRLTPETDQFPVNSIAAIGDTHVWTTMQGSGVYVWNRETGQLETYYSSSSPAANKLPTNNVGVIIDTQDEVWVTTSSEGVFSIEKNSLIKQIELHHRDATPTASGHSLNAFLEDSKGNYWLGTDNGLDSYHPESGKWKHYPIKVRPKKNMILALVEDQKGNIYASGYGAKIYKISPDGLIERLPTNRRREFIRSLYVEGDSLWLGGIIHRLRSFNFDTEKYTYYEMKGVLQLVPYGEHELLLATIRGLYRIDRRDGTINKFNLNEYDETLGALDNEEITGVHHSPSMPNYIWIATKENGVIKLNVETHQFTRYDVHDGLASNTVDYITQDNKGHLWVTTSLGINCIDVQSGQIETFNSIKQYIRDESRIRAIGQNKKGHLFFGSSNGLVEIVPPDTLARIRSGADLHFTRLMTLDEEGNRKTVASLSSQSLDDIRELKLNYNQHSFTLAFVDASVESSVNVHYSWRLKGHDDEWSMPSKLGDAVYTNVSPGDYEFEVKVVKTGATRPLAVRTLHIHVNTPIWRSTWAYIIYFLILCGIVYLIYYSYKAREEAEASDEKIRVFINEAQDIRTPLTLVKAPLVDLHQRLQEKGDRESVEAALSNTEKLINFSNQLLNFNKSEREAFHLQVEEIELKSLIEAIIIRFANVSRRAHITIVRDIADDLGKGYLDKLKIEIILDNLISSAIKYSKTQSEIHISATVSNGHLHIEVQDEGVDSAKKEKKQLFKRLFSANNAANERKKGIEMLVVKKLVEVHHGTIAITSDPVKGTTCSLALPLIMEAYGASEIMPASVDEEQIIEHVVDSSEFSPIAPPTQEGEEINLLFVEDDAELRKFLLRTFSGAYQVTVAKDGQEALELIEHNKPDYIVSNVSLSRMNGLELCRTIKNNIETCHIPVMLLTTLSDRDDFIEGFKAGADDYMAKPFDVEILKRKINNTLYNRRLFKMKYIDREIIVKKANREENESNEFLQRTMEIIEHHLSEEQLSVDLIAAEIGVSRSGFYKRIKALTNHNPQEIIKEVKMKKAAEFLQDGRFNVGEVSTMCGFPNVKYFSTVFKKYFGMTPTQYIKENDLTNESLKERT